MFKNFLRLLTGNALGQAIQLVALIFLSTLYNPDDFGRLGKIQSLSGIIVIILTLQLQYIIPLSENDKAARKDSILIFQILFLICVLILGVSSFISTEYLYASLLAFILGVVTIINSYLIYAGEFKKISIVFIFRSLFIVVLQFVFYYIKLYSGLLYAAILGELLALVYLIIQNDFKFVFNLKIRFGSLRELILRWKAYTFFGTIQEILSVLVYSLPVIFYVDKFGENIGGQFSMAFKIIWAPTVLISSSIAQVLTHRFGKDKDFSMIKSFIWFDRRLLFLVPVIFITLFNIDFLNTTFLHNKWSVSFQLFPYMFLNAGFFLMASPYRVALRVLKMNKEILKIEVLTILLMVCTFLLLDINVLQFTIAITTISILQNILIPIGYFNYKKKLIE